MMYHRGIAILQEGDPLPDPQRGPKNEPVAIGFDLTPELMLEGYRKGLFAWSVNPVTWWSPDPRAIIPLDGFYASKRLTRTLRKQPFRVTMDATFNEVVRNCGLPRDEGDGVWITSEFRESFSDLASAGHAHSVECWLGERLVGGVFGVAVNGFFSAESMFHTETDASKIALYYLVETLREAGFALLDIQILSAHTASLGAMDISRRKYLSLLANAVQVEGTSLGVRTLVD